MENKVNIAEILKDCPTGIELYSPLCGKCVFDRLNMGTIICKKQNTQEITFTSEGYYMLPVFDNCECMLFPSKDQRDWNKFHIPFKDGDIIVDSHFETICIFKGEGSIKGTVDFDCGVSRRTGTFFIKDIRDPDSHFGYIVDYNLATEEEKQKLFDKIKVTGYHWNKDTKTLKNLFEPKFYVGDKIKYKNGRNKDDIKEGVILNITDYTYNVAITNNITVFIPILDQDELELVSDEIKPKFKVGDRIRDKDNGLYCTLGEYSEGISAYRTNIGLSLTYKDLEQWELLPNKFDVNNLKSFDKVLVRLTNDCVWLPKFFSYYDTNPKIKYYPFVTIDNIGYPQCIPYENNEHLLGTTDDCAEIYKTW